MSLDRSKVIPFSHPFLIEPAAGFYDPHCYFLNAIQEVVDWIIPDDLWDEVELSKNHESLLYRLRAMLPIFKHTEITDQSESMTISYICPAEYTHHARCYVVDTLNKWLNPGKATEIGGGISLNFQFALSPTHRFFIAQDIIYMRTREENLAVRKNLPELIEELKKKLPCDFLRRAENNVHPIFMPRNEEETIRNLIVLAAQIKYVRDLPQLSLHFEKQTQDELTFTVIIARLLKGTIDPLSKVLEKSRLKMDIDDVRVMGYLKNKYPKHTAILRITLKKGPFFRADHSVDLLRARQKIVANFQECLGPFRDFNGGMILKQDESLRQLRGELGKLSQEKEFMLENYFYSLNPCVMQTVHETGVLKKHFELLNAVIEAGLNGQPYQIVTGWVGKFFLTFVASNSRNYKESLLDAIAPLRISPRDLTISFQQVDERSVIGFILQSETSEAAEKFHEAILKWSHRFYCIIR